MELYFGCGVWVFVALVVLWFLARTRGPKPVKLRDPDWKWTDFDPPMKPAHERVPDHVKHTLDVEASRYTVLWTWYNDDIAAESDIGIVTEDYDVRREDSGWQMRLARRNGSVTEGRPWQPAPAQFRHEWDSVKAAYELRRVRATGD